MKIIIVGAGLCGLYLAYLLKNLNIDFEIHEKTSRPGGRIKTINAFGKRLECGSHIIQPYHFNLLGLINKLKLNTSSIDGTKIFTYIDEINQEIFNNLLNKFKISYEKDKPVNISTIVYLTSIFTKIELNIFKSYIFIEQELNTEISNYMQYMYYDLKLHNQHTCSTVKSICLKNKYITIDGGLQLLTDKLAYLVQEKLYLNSPVTEITSLPITNSYIIQLGNGRLINADYLVLATDASIKNIRLSIPKEIKLSIQNVNAIPIMRLYTFHDKEINLNSSSIKNIIQTQSILTNIQKVDSNILSALYINESNSDLLYNLLINQKSNSDLLYKSKEIKKIIHTILQNIIGQSLPKVTDYIVCKWSYGSHYNTKKIKTNFWHKHNLILAGEWVHPYHNTLEGSVMSAIETFKIITNNLFEDKLKHTPDNIKSIEINRTKHIQYDVII